MSRIKAEVIDVLENRETRVELLSINGEDAGDFISNLDKHLYRHDIVITSSLEENDLGADSFTCYLVIYNTVAEELNIGDLFRLLRDTKYCTGYVSDSSDDSVLGTINGVYITVSVAPKMKLIGYASNTFILTVDAHTQPNIQDRVSRVF